MSVLADRRRRGMLGGTNGGELKCSCFGNFERLEVSIRANLGNGFSEGVCLW